MVLRHVMKMNEYDFVKRVEEAKVMGEGVRETTNGMAQ